MKTLPVFFALLITAITATAQTLKPFENENVKWGYKNAKGKTVVTAQYLSAHIFSEGLAAVAIINFEGDERWGFIDTKGNIVIPINLGNVLSDFDNGKAHVMIGDVAFYIDQTGKTVAAPEE